MKPKSRVKFMFGLVLLVSAFFFAFHYEQRTDEAIVSMNTGVVVSDLEKSLDFYTNVLGMTKVSTFRADAELAESAGLTKGKAIDVVNLKINDLPNAPMYKLAKIEGVKTAALSNSFNPGLRYITIVVNDLTPYLKRFKESDIHVWSKKSPVTAPQGFKVIVVQDPDGAVVELIQK
ncbi:VOC family protein [Spirosoma taeanense]|uniref:VOC family protein n=1 Tax=Spirosoma taeanense TaxID=2735870 RepID=A0A6M5Y703_9BACT|nr:VOC family protein [Spirosoma taeanense]QJW90178.1 VOC family protein [Spirosoma taeanense]